MIDALEAAIKYLRGRAELASLSDRISNKHRYGEEWTKDDASLILILDDSTPDWYVPIFDIRFEVWCMAGNDAAAMDTYLKLVEISRDGNRYAIMTSSGEALIYSFLPESGPSYVNDPELAKVNVKRVLSFWRVRVSENEIA
jgi:hypothetical protein